MYLLLLGPRYGHVFPETGQSATHDEWVAAQRRGIPRLVFHQVGVTFEPEQQAFAQQVGDYGTGNFYRRFQNAVDLQRKVVEALAELAAAPSPLTFEPLAEPAGIDWAADDERPAHAGNEALLVVHVRPIGLARMPNRLFDDLAGRLVAAIRTANVVDQSIGLVPARSSDAAAVSWPRTVRRQFGSVHPRELLSVRMNVDREVSMSWALPGDGLGVIVNEADLAVAIGTSLRAVGAMNLVESTRIVIGVELRDLGMASEGPVTGVSRTFVSVGHGHMPKTLRVEPDESLSDAALGVGADDVAAMAARSLMTLFRQGR